MLNTWLLVIKTIVIVSTIKSVYSWNPQCSPCRCFDQKNKKVSDCSSSTTTLQLTKIPDLRIETETVFLVGQQLRNIPEDAFFKGAKNSLKFVDLKNCKVRSVHANAFRNLEYLSGLDLSHNDLSQLDENVFGFNNKLSIIILQNNNLKVFPEKIFHNLPSLKYLDISKNSLHYIYPNQFETNINLERLILQSNYLTKFDYTLISNLPKLNVLYLDNNPWTCDCQTKDLLKLIIDRNIDFIYKDNYPLCSKPKQWKGKKWLDIKPRELCSVQNTLSVNVTDGEDFVVDCTLENTDNLEVEWFLNGQILSINNPQKYQVSSVTDDPNTLYKLRINNVDFSDMGVYKCWTTNLKGSDVQYEETIVNIQPGIKPVITGPEHQKKLVKNGETDYALSCDIVGSPPPNVEWLLDGKVLTFSEINCKRQQSSDNSLLIPRINPFCFGNYTCRAINSKGVAEKNYEVIALPQSKPKVDPVSNIDNNNAYESTSVSLNCFVNEDVELEVQWLRNGQIISPNDKYSIRVYQIDATTYNYILTIKEISFSQAGNYKCRANTVESPDYTINVKPGKEPIVEDFDNNNEITLETGANKDIPCKASGVPKPNITWQLPPNCNKDSYTEGVTLHLRNVDCSGRYKCIVTNVKGKTEKEFKLTIATPKISTTSIKTNYSDGKIFEYDDITLNCLVDGSVTSRPYWTFNNKPINVNNKKYKIETIAIPPSKTSYYYNLQIKNISLLERGNYKCQLGLDYKSVTVEVQPAKPPTINQISDPDQYVEEGTKDFKLECRISGTHSTVLWTSNNLCKFDQIAEDHDNYKTSILVIKEVHRSCNGEYICSANNKIGHAEKVVNLNVIKPEPLKTETESKNNNEALENEDIILKCLIRGAVTSEPKWKFNEKFDSNKHQIVKQEISKTSYWYNLIIKNLKPEDAGNYKCVLGNHEQTIALIVKPNMKPNIEHISNTQTIEAGMKNFQITCKVSGSPIPQTKWLKTGNFDDCRHEITRLVNGTSVWINLTIFEVTAACSGRYTCVATSSKEIETKVVDISVISIDGPPDIDIETLSIDNEVIENEDVTLKCFIKTRMFEPEWVHEGRTIRPNNKYKLEKVAVDETSYWFNLVISKIAFQDKGSYKCRVNNFERETTIGVQESKKPVIEYISNPNVVEKGVKNVILSCKVDGIPKPKVYWYYEGQQINNISSNQFSCKYTLSSDVNNNDYTEWLYLTIKEVDSSCAGKYKCSAENCNGQHICTANNKIGQAEKVVNLTVVKPEPPKIETESNNNNEAIENEDIILKCLIRGAVTTEPKWKFNEKFDSRKHQIVKQEISKTSYWYNLIIKNLKPEDAGNYKCVLGNHEQTIALIVKPNMKPNIEHISNTQTIEAGKKNFQITCKVSGSPIPQTKWLKTGNFDDCRHEINRLVNGTSVWINLTIFEVTAACSGRYTCVATSSKEIETKVVDISVISIDGPPDIDIETLSIDNEVIENEDVTLKCFIKTRMFEPEWVHQGRAIRPSNKYKLEKVAVNETSYWFNLVISKISFQDKGSYKCRVNNFEKETTIGVQESKKPVIEYISNPNVVEKGVKNVILSCKVDGIPKPKVYWYYEGQQINNISSNQFSCEYTLSSDVNDYTEWLYLSIKEVDLSCAGKYKCSAENFKGSEENEINLSVVTVTRPEIVEPPKNILENDNVTLQCRITGTFDSRPNWIHNNIPIELNRSDKYKLIMIPIDLTSYWYNLQIINISSHDKGNYKCKINNLETEILLETEPESKPHVIEFPSKEINIEEGTKEVTLTCEVSGNPRPEILWLYENIPIDKNINSNCLYKTSVAANQKNKLTILSKLIIQHVKPSCGRKYKCVAKNSKGTTEREVNVRVATKPKVEIQSKYGNQALENEEVALKCLVPNKRYSAEWYKRYEPVIIEPNGRYSITFEPVNETAYWHNLVISNLLPSDKGEYKCKINNLESIIKLDVQKLVKPKIEYMPTKEIIVTEGSKNVSLACKATGVPKPSVSWQHEPSQQSKNNCKHAITSEGNESSEWLYLTIAEVTPSCSGMYKCVSRNSAGFDQKYSILSVTPLKQTPLITMTTNSLDGIIRETDNVTLRCLSSGNVNSKVQWYHNNKPIDFEDKDKYSLDIQEVNQLTKWNIVTIKNVNLKDKGDYSCKVNNAEQSYHIEVERKLVPTVESLTNPKLIIDENTEQTVLPCKVTDLGDYVVDWTFNGRSVAESSCTTDIISGKTRHFQWHNLTILNMKASCAGQYKCVIRNLENNVNNAIDLTVLPVKLPEINVSSSSYDDNIREQDSVTLKCLITSSNSNAAKWLYEGQILTSDSKHKITKLFINDTTYWYNLEILNVSIQQSGDYKCNTGKSEVVTTLNIRPGSKPIIEYISNNDMIVEEDINELSLFCKAIGSPVPTIKWAHQTKTTIKRGDCRLQSRFEYHSNGQLNYLTITNIKPSCSGKIFCIATNSKGYANKIINLRVIPTQKAEITVKSTIPDIIREGDNVTLSSLVTGKNTGPVEWFFNDKNGGKNKGNFKVNTYEINPVTYKYDYVITNITLEQAGRYYFGRTENFVDIKVQPGTEPIVEEFPNENIVIYTGSKDTTLFCRVSGVPKPDASWLFNEKSLHTSKCKYEFNSNDQWYNLTIIDASTSCNGNYKCVVRNVRGTTEKETRLQVVEPLKPELKVTTNSTDGIIKENDKVTLTCLVKGDFNIPVMWLHNNNYIKQDKNHKIIKIKHDDVSFWYNLEIETISLNQGGNYECKTSKSRSVIDLNVQSTRKPTVTLSPASKVFVQAGTNDLILSCTETGMPVPSGTWEYNDIQVDSISACLNNCQYKLRSASNSDTGTRWDYLTISNITAACSGKYKCIAENSKGKAEKFVEVVVIEQPITQIQEPIHAVLNEDVTLHCQVTSIDTPSIIWKYHNKQVNPSTKHKITNYKGANNVYHSSLTIPNFQQTDFGDYTCEGKLHNLQNVKTVTLKAKAKFKPEFENPINMLENFKIINADIVFTTKVRGFPPPYLIWEIDGTITTPDKSLNDNTKYLAEVSYINDDQYWFNQTVKNFICKDIARHVFTVKNEVGEAQKAFFVDKIKGDTSETFSILRDDPIDYNGRPIIMEAA